MRTCRVDLRCPACGRTVRIALPRRGRSFPCPSCRAEGRLVAGGVPGEPVDRCLRCGNRALYTAKDFPRGIGIGIVIVAAVLAPFTWYLSLVVAAAIDALLFLRLGEAVRCYACGADHHGVPRNPDLKPYDIHLAAAHEARGG